MRKSALIMERGEALAGSRPPSRELSNPLMRRPLRPYTKIVDATVGSTSDFIGASGRSGALSKWARRLTIFPEILDI